MHSRIVVLLLVSTLLLSLPVYPNVSSETIRFVSNDFTFENTNESEWQTTKFDSINDAIDVADDGDTIYIYSGTYNDVVLIGKNVTITGENTSTTIIIGAGWEAHTISAVGNENNPISPQINHLTIQGPSGEGYDCIAFDYVENGSISDCVLQNSPNGDGIQLAHSYHNTIEYNTIINNDRNGIHLTQSGYNTLQHNTIQGNQKGIYLYETTSGSDNILTQNTITSNSQYGIHIQQSTNNLIYLNNLISNGENAYDNSNSQWSFENQGNYWDDYAGYDDNDDDIGDTPHPISGGDRYDYYPLGYFQEHSSSPGNSAPTAYSPTITPNPAQSGATVSFSGSGRDTDGSITAFRWQSNIDGTLSSQQSFSTNSLSVGTHTISFKVQDNNGAWSSEKTKELIITQQTNQLPTATILTITPNPALFSTEITFQATSYDPDGYIIDYQWLSNINGALSSLQNFTKDDLSIGTHTIHFRVKDNDGNWSEYDSMTLIIEEETTNLPPLATIVIQPNGTLNQPVSFDATTSTDPNTDDLLTYDWDFGDNTTSTQSKPTHLYEKEGVYVVTLTVTDGSLSNTTTQSITIHSSASQGNENPISQLDDFEIPFPVLIIIPLIFIGIIVLFFLKKA